MYKTYKSKKMKFMNSLDQIKNLLGEFEEKLAYVFENKELLITACVHRSFINEHRGTLLNHNERFEFIGDSVLGLVVATYLYTRLPNDPEGQLSQLRSRLVDAAACVRYAQKLGLADWILLGRGESLTGRAKDSITADAFEALIGAIYLDRGFVAARDFILLHFEEDFEIAIKTPDRNFKAELQDFSQKYFQKVPEYKVVEETGPQHAKMFRVVVLVNHQEAGVGSGASKKEAEQKAACDALSKKFILPNK